MSIYLVCPFLHSRYATCYQYCAKFNKGSPTAAKATAPRRNGTPVGGSSCTKLHDTTIQAQYSTGKNFTLFPEALNNTEEYMLATICMPGLDPENLQNLVALALYCMIYKFELRKPLRCEILKHCILERNKIQTPPSHHNSIKSTTVIQSH